MKSRAPAAALAASAFAMVFAGCGNGGSGGRADTVSAPKPTHEQTTVFDAAFAVTSSSQASRSFVIRYVLENCASLKHVDVVESTTTVAVQVRETRTDRRGVSCVTPLTINTMRVDLQAPLGTRTIGGQCTAGDTCERLRHPYRATSPK